MAQRGVPAGWDSPADRPSVLQITVESDSRPRAAVRRPHVLIASAVLAAIGAAIVVAVLVESGPPSATAPRLYRLPVGCVYSRVTAVERNRTGPCAPHSGFVTAVARRVGGVWRVTLEPTSQPCPQMPLPPLARGKVKPCRR